MASIELSDEDIKELLSAIERAQNELENARAIISKLRGELMLVPPDWERKRLKVWAEVHKSGDVVTYDEWKRICTEAGYDPRGTGGFFAGENASMMWVGEEKVALAKWAAKEVEKYKKWLEDKQ